MLSRDYLNPGAQLPGTKDDTEIELSTKEMIPPYNIHLCILIFLSVILARIWIADD